MPHSRSDNIPPQILFLDAYDSFSNNIIALLQEQLAADVHVIKIDDANYTDTGKSNFENLLQGFDAVVAGPGPGNPTISEDVGLINELWVGGSGIELPVLGICLGFQSLAYAYGARVERMPEPRHGIVQKIDHCNTSIFDGAGEAIVTHYHSLRVRLDHPVEDCGAMTDMNALWSPSKTCPDLIPLAWNLNDHENGPSLMSLRHRTKPLWAVQFHPESVCTNGSGAHLVQKWWEEVCRWRRSHRQTPRYSIRHHLSVPQKTFALPDFAQVHWQEVPFRSLGVSAICNALRNLNNEVMLLESGTTSSGHLVNSETGRFSIIGCVDGGNVEQFQYFAGSKQLAVLRSDTHGRTLRSTTCVSDIWQNLKNLMISRKAVGGPSHSPFWGGLIGYVSYEACLDTIQTGSGYTEQKPDIWFVFIQKSIVIDHVAKRIYVQSLCSQSEGWIAETCELLSRLPSTTLETVRQTAPKTASSSTLPVHPQATETTISGPSRAEYCNKIRACLEQIRAGNSYELCLTDQTKLLLPPNHNQDSWTLYNRLRTLNPAPFSAYLRFSTNPDPNHTHEPEQGKHHGLTILSSSPERFLSWSRTGSCQFRPIKGTVSKSTAGMTREKAELILQSSKERAENLMIVDLVRHDLHGVVGAGNVRVSKLMGMEEYETVYQLVSVIEGQIPPPSTTAVEPESEPKPGRDNSNVNDQEHLQNASITGIDVLSASLPPGSMTGAPKRRSCTILQDIEDHKPRGIYSGVLGYLDVGGGGDFSVVIRTAWRWDADVDADTGGQMWRVGAGGAVTSQSNDEAEYEEMCIKRERVLKVFEG